MSGPLGPYQHQPLPPIDLARIAALWGWPLDDLEAALAVEHAREGRDSRRGRTSGRRQGRPPVHGPRLPGEYGWCDW